MSKNLIKVAILIVTTLQLNLNIVQADIQKQTNPVLEIPKINLKQEIYPDNKEKNNVDKGIQIIETSKMPNQKGNLILAAHSGSSDIAYFKHLDRLNINDIAFIYYKNIKYKYIITNIYDVEKTGYVDIKRDKNKQTLTLITCKKNTNKQTVYIGYLAP